MSIIWADGFQHYGTTPNGGRDAMLSGAWAAFGDGAITLPIISTAQARTGTRSIKFTYIQSQVSGCKARRVIGSARTVVGAAMGLYFDSLPSMNKIHGFELRTASNSSILMVTIQADGALALYTGPTYDLLATSDPVYVATSWQHLEFKAVIDNIVGSFELRLNGIVILHLTDINLGSNGATQIVWGQPNLFNTTGGNSVDWYLDDVVLWDDAGSYANDFLGSVRVETLMPNADTAEADWTLNGAASGYDCIDDASPDGDTTYLMSDVAGEISEFEISDSPPETANIKGIYIPVMAKLGAAGTGNIRVSLNSNGGLSGGPDVTLTTAYTYWGASHMVDPDTGLPWTKAAVDALKVRIEKIV